MASLVLRARWSVPTEGRCLTPPSLTPTTARSSTSAGTEWCPSAVAVPPEPCTTRSPSSAMSPKTFLDGKQIIALGGAICVLSSKLCATQVAAHLSSTKTVDPQLHSFNVSTICVWVITFTRWQIYSLVSVPVTIWLNAVWAPDPLWTFRRKENVLLLSGIELQFFGCSARSLVPVPTAPCRLSCAKKKVGIWKLSAFVLSLWNARH